MTTTLGSDRDRDALRSFARRIDPSDAGAHNNLGVLYYNKGLYEEAAAAFTKALELDAKMQVAQRNLEVAYLNTGYYDKRVAQLRERLRVRVDDREARWELGRAYALLGEYEEAVAEFEALLRHHPGDLGALTGCGDNPGVVLGRDTSRLGVAIGAGVLYFTDPEEHSVRKCALAECLDGSSVLAVKGNVDDPPLGLGDPSAIAVGGSHVYWTSPDDGVVASAAK